MAQGLFVTGTDTACGKTEISLGLMHRLQSGGLRVAGMKPVASGAERTPTGLRNEDARRIQQQTSFKIPYEQVNPYAYEPPIAPHLAAMQANRPVDLEHIRQQYARLSAQSDRVVVEGVGGWCVPLGPGLVIADLVKRLDLPVVLVVGLRLGCLNHAFLTEQSIRHTGLKLQGWIANRLDPDMHAQQGNLQTLLEGLAAPCLGVVPYLQRPSAQQVAAHLRGVMDISG